MFKTSIFFKKHKVIVYFLTLNTRISNVVEKKQNLLLRNLSLNVKFQASYMT